MTNEDQTPAPVVTARPAIVTIDDVRQQLETLALDARKTNASVIQKALGRGGMGTVQKHLDSLRAELDRPVVVVDGEIPAAPRETLDAIWRSAWTAAQAHTSASLASALLERDQAREALATAREDVGIWTASAEAAETAAEVAAVAEAAAVAAAEAAKAALEASIAARAADAEAARAALEALIAARAADASAGADSASKAAQDAAVAMSALQAQHALEKSHAETKFVTLQAVIDRMTEQLADVKSLLPRHAASTPT